MLMLLSRLLIVGVIALWVYCVLDVVRAEQEAVKYLHKIVWLVFVVFVPTVGSLAWLLLGRPVPIGSRLIPKPRPQPTGAPDDSPEFLARLDEEIRRRRRAEQMRRPPTDDIDPQTVDEEIARLEESFQDPEDGNEEGPDGGRGTPEPS